MAITVTINAPSPVVIGVPYVGSAVASGGTAPYTYSVDSGSLPDGLNLDAVTGIVSGIPLLTGNFDADILATDSVAATGNGDFPVIVVPALQAPASAVINRVPIKWNSDECLKAGHQMARLFYDAKQQPNFTTTLSGNLQQPIGLVKSLLFFAHLQQTKIPRDVPGPLSTLIIESTLSGQRISIGVPTLEGQGVATSDVFINGCVPFFCNDESPVNLTLDEFGLNAYADFFNVRLFFCNFEVPPFFYATYDNTQD